MILSIIIPVYNEAENINECYLRLSKVMQAIKFDYELVFVDDGSTDLSWNKLTELHQKDNRVSLIKLSRNYGKEIAMTAGLDYVNSDAVIIIDADLQDPPELIPKLIEKWQQGFDVVYAKRQQRQGESRFKKLTAFLFYRILTKISPLKIPEDAGDFRLLSRRAVEALNTLRERHRFMKGLYSWIGYPQAAVLYDREPRLSGKTKWNYWKLWNFAIDGITSFTTTPLKLASYFGLVISIFSFIFMFYIIAKTLIYGNPVAGYASAMVVILFLGGCQLMAIGIIGEYLGRLFDESKNRPLYFIESAQSKTIPHDDCNVIQFKSKEND